MSKRVNDDVERLLRDIHARVHQAMANGQIPTAIELGWQQYGTLYWREAHQPDDGRPHEVLDLPIVPVAVPNHLVVRATDRRGW